MDECVSEHLLPVLSFTLDHGSSFLVQSGVGVVDSRQQLGLIVEMVACWVLAMWVASLVEYTDWNLRTYCFVRLVADAWPWAFDQPLAYCGTVAVVHTLPCTTMRTNNGHSHWLLSVEGWADYPMSWSTVLAVMHSTVLRVRLLQRLVPWRR